MSDDKPADTKPTKRTHKKSLSLYPLTDEEALKRILDAGPMPEKAAQKARARARRQQKQAEKPQREDSTSETTPHT